MTDGSGSYFPLPAAAPAAGWYPDPAGSPRQRWWNGAAWTMDLHYPEPPVYGRLAPTRVLAPDTPAYTAAIWIITLLPLLSLINVASTDLTADFNRGLSEGSTGTTTSATDVLSQLLSIAVYAASVTLAYFDRRRLLADGFTRPFHWAWTFLSSGVYVIGRSIVVRNQAGRGLTPIWVWTGIVVLTTLVTFAKFAALVPLFLTTIGSGIAA